MVNNQRLITSDIQIFTGCMPFYEIPREPTVMVRVGQGWRPKRPPTRGVHGYPCTLWGLTEAIWELMEDCWAHNPSDRLVVQDIVARLSSVCKTDDRPGKVPSSVRIQNSVVGNTRRPWMMWNTSSLSWLRLFLYSASWEVY